MNAYEDAYKEMADLLKKKGGTKGYIERSMPSGSEVIASLELDFYMQEGYGAKNSNTIIVLIVIKGKELVYSRWVEFPSKPPRSRLNWGENFAPSSLPKRRTRKLFKEAVDDATENYGWQVKELFGSEPLIGVGSFVSWLNQ